MVVDLVKMFISYITFGKNKCIFSRNVFIYIFNLAPLDNSGLIGWTKTQLPGFARA